MHGLTQLHSLELEGMSDRALRSFLRGLSPDTLPQLTDITMETLTRVGGLFLRVGTMLVSCMLYHHPCVYHHTLPGCSTRFPLVSPQPPPTNFHTFSCTRPRLWSTYPSSTS